MIALASALLSELDDHALNRWPSAWGEKAGSADDEVAARRSAEPGQANTPWGSHPQAKTAGDDRSRYSRKKPRADSAKIFVAGLCRSGGDCR